MTALLSAHEGGEKIAKIQKDRERLIDLVLNLEVEFGKTIQDYTQLQKEYASLLNRPAAPDQESKIKALQKQLEVTTATLKARQKDQADTDALLQQDVANLRNELYKERQNLLVAKAQLLRVKQLEQKSQSLEASLKKETDQRATAMGELQAIRGERDALLGKVEGLMARAETAETSHRDAKVRIGELEKETNTLRLKVQGQEVELRKLGVDHAKHEETMAAAEDLRKEQKRLTSLLTTREKELNGLRADLAVEMKRSLDVPVLIKARDDLQKKLTASHGNADGLKKKNKALTAKQVQLQKEIETVQKSIKAMQVDLSKNKNAMTQVAKLGEKNQLLTAEQEELKRTIAIAKEELVKSRATLQSTEAKLADSLKKSKNTEELKKKNAKILAQLEAHKTQVAGAKAEMSAMQKRVEQNQAALKAAGELGEKVKVLTKERGLLTSKLEEAKVAHLDAEAKFKTAQASLLQKGKMSEAAKKAKAESAKLSESLAASQIALKKAEKAAAQAARLKKDYDALTTSAAGLGKQKASLSAEVAKRDDDLKKLRAEMAKKEDLSANLAELQKEKEKLASDLAKREADLKKTRSELGRLKLSASAAQKQLDVMKRESAKIEPVRYAKGEADVTKQQARVLAQVQQVLKLFPEARFEIVGHTCDLGSVAGNLRLSQERAKALQDFLIEKGVKAERLKSRGVGQAEPAVPNVTEANRRQNRRVIVEILD